MNPATADYTSPPSPVRWPAGSAAVARPARVLLVEDEPLIALALARELENAGFAVIGPAATVADALRHLRGSDGCDAAVLDVNLGRETSAPVALELIASYTPIVVLSGYARSQQPLVFHDMPALAKPVRVEMLLRELRLLLPPQCNE